MGRRRAWRLTPRLATTRLGLDPLRLEDADEMVEVLADPALYRFTGGEPPGLPDLARRFAAQVAGRSEDGREAWHNWVLRTAGPDGDARAIGFVQATVTDGGRRADIAWVIGAPWQGHGYAVEAARAMVAWLVGAGVTTVTAHVNPGHGASARVAELAGLTATKVLEDGERVWRLGPG